LGQKPESDILALLTGGPTTPDKLFAWLQIVRHADASGAVPSNHYVLARITKLRRGGPLTRFMKQLVTGGLVAHEGDRYLIAHYESYANGRPEPEPGPTPLQLVMEEIAMERGYTTDFDEAWRTYPKRMGSNPKKLAWKQWNRRMVEGTPTAQLLQATRGYAASCEDSGIVGTEKVLQAATFYGPNERWVEFENYKPANRPLLNRATLDLYQ
jgi:hypothetical protein